MTEFDEVLAELASIEVPPGPLAPKHLGISEYVVVKPHYSRQPIQIEVIKVVGGVDELVAELDGDTPADAAMDLARSAGPNAKDWGDCLYCGNPHPEPFMVKSGIWREAGLGTGLIHLECLEEQLGRELTMDDFTEAPINSALKFGFMLGKHDAIASDTSA